jgi:hypothetical protein
MRALLLAAFTDGRYSGGFTPEATVAARHANAFLRHHPNVGHPHAGGRGDGHGTGWRRNWPPASSA